MRAEINGQELVLTQPVTAADTVDYLTLQASFRGAAWQGAEKWAHFSQGETVYDVRLIHDRIEKHQHLNLTAGFWSFYIHGTNGGTRVTTNRTALYVYPAGMTGGQPLPEIPLSAAEQIQAQAAEAVAVAEKVRADARAGRFDGPRGPRGKQGVPGRDGGGVIWMTLTNRAEVGA